MRKVIEFIVLCGSIAGAAIVLAIGIWQFERGLK
jgi:hypothetical protein